MKRNIFYFLSVLLVFTFFSSSLSQDSDHSAKEETHDIAQNITSQDDTTGMSEFIEVEVMPDIVTQMKPVYPIEAIKKKIEGRVWIKLKVGTNGVPSSVVVVKSTNSIFDDAAVTAAKQYKFTSAMKDGKQVAVWVVIPFKFELSQAKEEKKTEQDCYLRNAEETPNIIGGKSFLDKLVDSLTARGKKIEGKMVIKVFVDENGNVDATQILKAIGSGYDEAAEKVVRKSKFSPARQDGKNVKGQVNISMQFHAK